MKGVRKRSTNANVDALFTYPADVLYLRPPGRVPLDLV